ncbi:MAG TPA: DUF3298 and DUF4163 domain-containing protein [Candidatus Amulumruptor caecigallinarius]|uniref:DUF3298 and DUF4163 domain-containing protein n=1 Tax=Candidatus Amulumruptor caecigallinarius TaxID=2109911 RepID=A0A921E8M8_9BACT|nr:DUF3298 and DUF4163 domain-containing protein [Candidatus Amulumruptor caecigallinarius]
MKITASLTAAAVAATTLLAACSGNGGETAGSEEISNFEIREQLKSASKSYKLVYASGDTAYVTLSATVQWPVEFGGSDLIALRDTIINALGTKSPYNIDQAMSAYVNNNELIEAGPQVTVSPVDSISPMTDETNSYDIETTIKVTELNEQTVTYQIYNYSFTGGAHPNYAYIPFTYDLSAGKVLTFDMLFKPGSDDALMTLIQEALANQLGVRDPAKLGEAGVFTDQLFVSRNVFVSDGQIVFHYNPYEIGPYALGQMDVALAPFVIENLLTSEAKSLLLN